MSVARTQGPPIDFAAETESAMSRVRATLAQLIADIPDFTYRRPNDLAADLGLDPKLAWNLGRCVEVADPFASARFVPGPTGMRAFLRAAERRGVPKPTVVAAREALDAFYALVHTHAGTRKSFNVLVGNLSTTERARSDVEHRRMLFDGATYVWGVQARTIFRANVVYPSMNPEMLDVVTVRGLIDFRPMRPHVAWRIARPFSVDRSHVIHEARRAVVDPRSAEAPLPLLTDFCSRPIPQFRPVVGAFDTPEYEFVERSVGNTARITFVTGELLQQIEPRYRTALYPDFCTMFPVRTPAETLVLDLLIHRDLFADGGPPTAELCSDLFGGGPTVRYEPADRLPLHEPLVHLGTGLGGAHTPDIPRYGEMLRYALDAVGWRADGLEHYRVRIPYPPISTTVMLRGALPDAPDRPPAAPRVAPATP